jgi:NAD-dependent deacetylase
MMEDGRYWRRAPLVEEAHRAALRMDQPPLPPAGEDVPVPQAVVDLFRRAPRITFLLGAGISRATGIPTYRGVGSLARPPEERGKKKELLPPLNTFPYYLDNPDVVWAHYAELRRLMAARRPTPAHHVVAALTRAHAGSRVITQNIDGLEGVAGVTPIALHGQAAAFTCLKEGCNVPARDARYNDDTFPICPNDGALLKPGVTFFLEGIDGKRFDGAIDQIRDSDLYVEVGTSHTVYPAKDFWKFARSRGIPVVIFNAEPLKDAHEGVRLVLGDCQRSLPGLYRQLFPDGPLAGSVS